MPDQGHRQPRRDLRGVVLAGVVDHDHLVAAAVRQPAEGGLERPGGVVRGHDDDGPLAHGGLPGERGTGGWRQPRGTLVLPIHPRGGSAMSRDLPPCGRRRCARSLPPARGAAVRPSARRTPRPFDAHDLVTMDRVSDPQPSPDGLGSPSWCAPPTSRPTRAAPTCGWSPRRRRAPAADRPTRPPTARRAGRPTAGASTSSPRARAPPRSGGCRDRRRRGGPGDRPAARRRQLPVSPDGARLAVILDVFPDCETLACTAERLEARGARRRTRQALRPPLRAPLGHLERRPPLAPFVRAGDGGGDAVDVTRGPRRRRALEAVRRHRGDRLHAGRQGARVHGAGGGRRGALVDQLRPLSRRPSTGGAAPRRS